MMVFFVMLLVMLFLFARGPDVPLAEPGEKEYCSTPIECVDLGTCNNGKTECVGLSWYGAMMDPESECAPTAGNCKCKKLKCIKK